MPERAARDPDVFATLEREIEPEKILASPERAFAIMGDVLAAALRELSVEEREAVLLVALAGMRVAEVARLKGVATGAIKKQIFRARARLRDRLESKLGVQ